MAKTDGWITEALHGRWRIELIGGRRHRYAADWGSNGQAIANDFSRIYLVESGEGEVSEAGRRIQLRPGQCYCFGPERLRLYRCSGAFELSWLHCRLVLEPGIDASLGLLDTGERPASGTDRDDMHELLCTLGAAGPAESLLQIARLARLMSGFLRPDWPDQKQLGAAQTFQDVLDFMQAHLTTPIRLDELAALQGWHPTWFSNRFSAVFGCGPMRYLAQMRLARSYELLRSSNLTVCEVASRCGFDDPAYFSRAFKRRYGIPPRQARHMAMDG